MVDLNNRIWERFLLTIRNLELFTSAAADRLACISGGCFLATRLLLALFNIAQALDGNSALLQRNCRRALPVVSRESPITAGGGGEPSRVVFKMWPLSNWSSEPVHGAAGNGSASFPQGGPQPRRASDSHGIICLDLPHQSHAKVSSGSLLNGAVQPEMPILSFTDYIIALNYRQKVPAALLFHKEWSCWAQKISSEVIWTHTGVFEEQSKFKPLFIFQNLFVTFYTSQTWPVTFKALMRANFHYIIIATKIIHYNDITTSTGIFDVFINKAVSQNNLTLFYPFFGQ